MSRGWWKDVVNEGDSVRMWERSEQEKVKFLQSAPLYRPPPTPPSSPTILFPSSKLRKRAAGWTSRQAFDLRDDGYQSLSFLLSLHLSAARPALSLYSHTTSSTDTHLIRSSRAKQRHAQHLSSPSVHLLLTVCPSFLSLFNAPFFSHPLSPCLRLLHAVTVSGVNTSCHTLHPCSSRCSWRNAASRWHFRKQASSERRLAGRWNLG